MKHATQLRLWLVVVAALVGACGGSAPPAGPPLLPPGGELTERPSILLITVDTLRRDHLGCYGYFRDTSPTIDALAAEGVLFERALASMATTFPSHLSMLTGLYPHQHGRTSNRDGLEIPFRSTEGCASVAAVLKDQGYDTAAFVSSTVLHSRTGIGEGFDHFVHPLSEERTSKAEHMSDLFLEWLADREGDAPFFAWLHYWDPHEPNAPPREHLALFETSEALHERIAAAGISPDRLLEEFGDDDRVLERFFRGPSSRADRRRRRHRGSEKNLDAEVIAELWNRYDADVHYVDAQIGRVLAALEERGLRERSIVAFTADHGQELGENLSFGHGRSSNINTFVPLILRFPPGVIPQPVRVQALVSLVDLAPTFLGRLDPGGLEGFLAQTEGEDLLSGRFRRDLALTQESTRFHRGGDRDSVYALLSGPWKYVQTGAEAELYDLADGGEYVDVRTEHPEVERRLKSRLMVLLRRIPRSARGDAAPDEEAQKLLDNLAEMGYGGGD